MAIQSEGLLLLSSFLPMPLTDPDSGDSPSISVLTGRCNKVGFLNQPANDTATLHLDVQLTAIARHHTFSIAKSTSRGAPFARLVNQLGVG